MRFIVRPGRQVPLAPSAEVHAKANICCCAGACLGHHVRGGHRDLGEEPPMPVMPRAHVVHRGLQHCLVSGQHSGGCRRLVRRQISR